MNEKYLVDSEKLLFTLENIYLRTNKDNNVKCMMLLTEFRLIFIAPMSMQKVETLPSSLNDKLLCEVANWMIFKIVIEKGVKMKSNSSEPQKKMTYVGIFCYNSRVVVFHKKERTTLDLTKFVNIMNQLASIPAENVTTKPFKLFPVNNTSKRRSAFYDDSSYGVGRPVNGRWISCISPYFEESIISEIKDLHDFTIRVWTQFLRRINASELFTFYKTSKVMNVLLGHVFIVPKSLKFDEHEFDEGYCVPIFSYYNAAANTILLKLDSFYNAGDINCAIELKNEKDFIVAIKKLNFFESFESFNGKIGEYKYFNLIASAHVPVKILESYFKMIESCRDYYKSSKSGFDAIFMNKDSQLSPFTLNLSGGKQKTIEKQSTGKFYSKLHMSKWLKYVGVIIHASFEMANHIMTSSILLCSKTYYSGTIIAALVKVIIDEHYRTIKGLIDLICEEFITPGHFQAPNIANFNQCGHYFEPGLILFFNSLYNLMHVYVDEFEYNSNLLVLLSDMFYAGLFDFYSPIHTLQIPTTSLDPHALDDLWMVYRNPYYIFTKMYCPASQQKILRETPFLPPNLQFWEEYFLRYNAKSHEYFSIKDGTINKIINLLFTKNANKPEDKDGVTENNSEYTIPKNYDPLTASTTNKLPLNSIDKLNSYLVRRVLLTTSKDALPPINQVKSTKSAIARLIIEATANRHNLRRTQSTSIYHAENTMK